ncbi:MAG: efflux RND transporter permease subunit [Phycisphaerae bacterium]|nr:efflux RND transporter permease subunit [Phycisphaerae bacterium]
MSWLRGLIAAGVRNPVYAKMLVTVIVAGAVYAVHDLVRETYPEFSLDRVSVEVAYPGASPEEVEQGICLKVEESLEGLTGIRRVWSRAAANGALIMAELREDVADPRLVMLDIKDRVDRITTLPPEAERPVVAEVVVRHQVIHVAIYGDVPERAIKELAVEVKEELLAHALLSQVEWAGVRDDEITIQVSQEALLQYGLTLEAVAAIVAKDSLDVPAGTLRTRDEELTLRTTGQRYTAQEFEDLVVIAQPDGALIRLGQIATITDSFEESFKSGRFQGQPAAILEVYKTPDQDTSTIARIVREYVEHKRAALPAGLAMDVWADSSRQVDARIAMLAENGLFGMALVVFTLTLFLDFRISLCVAFGIPISFAGALMAMHWLGQSLNMITLFGLIMVTGLIVDDAIVIADSFRMRAAAGDPPALAAVNGAWEVAQPVLASSGTTVLAFLPLLFVVGIMGKFIAVLPVVVIAAIAFSTIEAFCILPSHLKHCLHTAGRPPERSGRLERFRIAMEAGIDWVIVRLYRPLVRRAVRARAITIGASLACLLAAAGAVLGGRVPFTLLPEIDGDMLRARIRFPQGVPVERAREAVRQIELAAARLNDRAILAHAGEDDLVRRVFSVVGEWSGWIDEEGSHLGEVLIELAPAEERRLDSQVALAAWAEQAGIVHDAIAVTFTRAQQGPTEKPLEIRLLGNDLDVLLAAAEQVATKLGEFAGVTGVEHDLQPGKREVRIELKPMARTLGVTVEALAQQLRSGFHGGEAVRVQRRHEEVRVQVRYPDAERKHLAELENMRVRGPNGSEIPFRELASVHLERGFANIFHQDGQRRVRITADVDERRANAEQVLAAMNADFLAALPQQYPGVTVRLEGQHAQMLESLRSLFAGQVLALVAIYAVLGAMLASYTQPFVILAAVPLGFIGAIVGHAVTGHDLTIMSVFGMVALSGVVVNDSLVLLDQINERIRAGRPVLEAVLASGELRFRAVLLTTLTTVAGLAPLLLERSTQAQTLIPMAVSLTFGLAFATLLTLVVVPSLFLVLSDVRRASRWLRRGGAYPSAEAVEPTGPAQSLG